MSRRRPGNGSATLLDMLSNLFYFSLFLAGGEEHGKREEESERARGEDAEGEAEAHPPPLTCYPPHTSTPFSNIASSERSRSLSPPAFPPPLLLSSPLPSPSFHPSFSRFVSLLRSFLEEEEKMEARHETRKREERSLVGGAGGEKGGGERKRGATVSFGCNERTE